MKKLLSILTSLSVASVAATSVVACSTPSTKINVNFTFGKDGKYTVKQANGDAEYSLSELDQAMNGNFAAINNLSEQYHVAMSFDELNTQLLSLVSFNQSMAVKTQNDNKQLRDFRNNLLGRDANDVPADDYKDVPSVDGIRYKKIDDNDYYSKFKNTSINSLTGLRDLYEATQDKNIKIGDGLAESQKEAANLFKKNKDVSNEVMSALFNSKKNPAFTNITYDTNLVEFASNSQLISSFDKNSKDNKLVLSPDSKSFKDNNADVMNEKDKTDDSEPKAKKIQDMSKADPYGVLILPLDKDSADPKITTSSFVDNGKDYSASKTLKELFEDNSDSVNYAITTDDQKTYNFVQNVGQYYVRKAAPLKVRYHFESDLKHDGQSAADHQKGSKGFNVSFTVNNLAEVFSPMISPVQGNTISSISHTKDKKINITFTKHIDDDLFKDKKVKILVDGTDKTDELKNEKDKAATLEIDSAKEIVVTDANGVTYTYAVTNNDSELQTNQLSWVFRGYKFINPKTAQGNEAFGWNKDVTEEKWVDQKDKSGSPVRGGNLAAEIEHNMRDLNISDWAIEQAEPNLEK